MTGENNPPGAGEGGRTGDQVEEIYWAIAELQRLYERARVKRELGEEVPPELRAILEKLREIDWAVPPLTQHHG